MAATPDAHIDIEADNGDVIKPSLWHRLFDSSVSVFNEQINRPNLTHTKHVNIIDSPSVLISGGGAGVASIKNGIHFSTMHYILGYINKALLRVLILSIAMYISLILITLTHLDKKITHMNDDNNNQLPESFTTRYWLIIALYLVFLVLTTIFYYVIRYIIYGSMYTYISMKAPKGANVADLVSKTWNNFWTTFQMPDGEKTMTSFDQLVMFALYGLLIFFALYTMFARSFITQLNYPNYTGLDEGDIYDPEREFSTPRKLITHQSAFIVCFLLIVLCFSIIQMIYQMPLSGWWQGVFSVGAILWVIFYAVFFVMTIRYDLQRKLLPVILSILMMITFVVMSFFIL